MTGCRSQRPRRHWGGAAISAVGAPFAAVIVQRYARRAGHTSRLWEQRIAAYEYVLSDAEWWRELRAETMRAIRNYDIELFPVTGTPGSAQARPEIPSTDGDYQDSHHPADHDIG